MNILKIANRGHLKRLIKKGMIEVRCDHHFTDDYAFDKAYNYGKTGWMDAVLCDTMQNIDGKIVFTDWDLKTKSGALWTNDNKIYNLSIHSNLTYSVRIKDIK